MNNPEEVQLNLHPRPTETVSIRIPTDTLQSIQKIAAVKDMSVEALLKFYIGRCLRQDLAQQFSGHLMESTAQVLARHIQSEEEITKIIQEIQQEISL